MTNEQLEDRLMGLQVEIANLIDQSHKTSEVAENLYIDLGLTETESHSKG